jgi:serine/threonine-protein kinase
MEPGTVIEGKYRISRLLGQGGMGAVYEGINTLISRRVAIKVLHASLASKQTPVERFKREAHAAGRIGSEHIVEVIDIGSLPSGELFMVMEFLEGEDLGTRIKKLKRLKPYDAAAIVHQVLEGLTAAHKAGIIHRDLKPENIYLVTSRAGRRDFVKVLDFGVSKFSDLAGESMSMTSTGAVVGTPYYLSPEQARGLKNIDARSDLYSVGVVLYQAVTGRLPFNAETFNELVFKIALEEPEPAEVVVPNLDRSFAAIIGHAMVRDVNGRFQTAREFQEALEQWMAMNPSPDAPRASSSGASWPGAGVQPSHAGNYYPGAQGAPAMGPYAAAHPAYGADPYAAQQQGMRSGAYAPAGAAPGAVTGAVTGAVPGAVPGAAYGAAPGGYAQAGGYAGAPMMTPQPGAQPPGAPMMTPAAQPGAPPTTPQPGALQVAATPPKKRGIAIAAAIVGAISIAGGAFGAYLLFGRSEPQSGTPTQAEPTTQAKIDPPAPPTATPSQAPSAEATAEPTAATPPSAPTAATTPTAPVPPAPNNASAMNTAPNTNTNTTKPPGTAPGPGKAPTPTATTATTAPPKPTGRVIGSEL